MFVCYGFFYLFVICNGGKCTVFSLLYVAVLCWDKCIVSCLSDVLCDASGLVGF